jgi:hypothetical protein
MDGDTRNKTKINSSPERGTFQKNCHIEHAEEKGEQPDPAIIEMWDNWSEWEKTRRLDPEWQKDNLEYDLRSTKWICDKAKANDWYAQNLYAAMCNMQFQRVDVWPILTNKRWSASWRSAGGIVADMLEKGDYIDWYCSGMGGLATYDIQEGEEYVAKKNYVPEGTVTDEIRNDLRQLGWIAVEWEDDDK